jgi:hypothetical protein
VTITRLTGGLTPGDGADPRTFPAIFNAAADVIEAQGSAVDVIEAWNLDDLNDVTYGTALAEGQVLVYSTAVSAWVNGTATGGGGSGNVADDVIQPNFNTISNNYTFPDGYNGVSAGPVTIASGATVTVGTASAWSIV